MTKSLKKAATTKSGAKSKANAEFTLVSADPKLSGEISTLIERMPGSKMKHLKSGKELLASKQSSGVLLLDDRLPDWNAYELCRRFKSTTTTRVFVLNRPESKHAAGIAKFCGADGALALPLDAEALQSALTNHHPDVKIDELLRKAEKSAAAASFPESLLKDSTGEEDRDLIDAIIDPETKLFNYAFLSYKLDEEFKRAMRFKYPLACVMLGFDGEASADVLLNLAGIFLSHSRDTDVLGRFDLNSFLFLLPNTGLSGAQVMAERVMEAAKDQKLKDLVGESLEISVGISCCPHSSIVEREDLFAASRTAFEEARQQGGGIEVSDGKP